MVCLWFSGFDILLYGVIFCRNNSYCFCFYDCCDKCGLFFGCNIFVMIVCYGKNLCVCYFCCVVNCDKCENFVFFCVRFG